MVRIGSAHSPNQPLGCRGDPRLNNTAGYFFTPDSLDVLADLPNQQFRIDVMDPAAPAFDADDGVLRALYRADDDNGGPVSIYQCWRFDLSAFTGRSVRLRFAVATTGVGASGREKRSRRSRSSCRRGRAGRARPHRRRHGRARPLDGHQADQGRAQADRRGQRAARRPRRPAGEDRRVLCLSPRQRPSDRVGSGLEGRDGDAARVLHVPLDSKLGDSTIFLPTTLRRNGPANRGKVARRIFLDLPTER